jgi:hypothetical protein
VTPERSEDDPVVPSVTLFPATGRPVASRSVTTTVLVEWPFATAWPDTTPTEERRGAALAGTEGDDEIENSPGPAAFTAATSQTYAAELLTPDTTRRRLDVGGSDVHVDPESAEYLTTKPVTADPPSNAGDVHVTTSRSDELRYPETAVGGFGTVNGVADMAVELGDRPAALIATTDTEYVVPLVKPVTVQLVLVVEHVKESEPLVAVA